MVEQDTVIQFDSHLTWLLSFQALGSDSVRLSYSTGQDSYVSHRSFLLDVLVVTICPRYDELSGQPAFSGPTSIATRSRSRSAPLLR